MSGSRNTRDLCPDKEERETAALWAENRRVVDAEEYVHPRFAAAHAERMNAQAQQAEGSHPLGQEAEGSQAVGANDPNIESEDSGSEDGEEQRQDDQVYENTNSELLMHRILRWETDAQELQGMERLITPFPDEGAQLRMPPRTRGLSDAHIAIYSARPPTPHPFFENASYPTIPSPSTAPITPPNQMITSGDTVPNAPRRHSTCLHGTRCASSPTPSSEPSDAEPDPVCGVCYRRSANVQLVGCSHSLCATCTRRTYFSSQTHYNNWPLGIDCPFCRRLVQFVKSDEDSGRMRRLPLWVVRWSIKGRTRVMRAHKRTVEPEEMRGWVGFMQNAISEGRYPPLTNHGSASSVVVGTPAPPAGPNTTESVPEGEN